MTRDMTKAQFSAACGRAGFTPEGFAGYYRIPHPDGNGATCVSVLNAGPRLRDRLAYLHAAADRIAAEHAEQARRADGLGLSVKDIWALDHNVEAGLYDLRRLSQPGRAERAVKVFRNAARIALRANAGR